MIQTEVCCYITWQVWLFNDIAEHVVYAVLHTWYPRASGSQQLVLSRL